MQMLSKTARYAPWYGLFSDIYGLQAQDIKEQVSVSPFSVDIFWTIACMGVSWFLPPKGIRTVPAPMVESNCSERPRFEQVFKSEAMARQLSLKVPDTVLPSYLGSFVSMVICFSAPFESRKLRLTSTILFPRQVMVRRGSPFTLATGTA